MEQLLKTHGRPPLRYRMRHENEPKEKADYIRLQSMHINVPTFQITRDHTCKTFLPLNGLEFKNSRPSKENSELFRFSKTS